MVNSQSTVANNLRFQGQYFDAETGLHYNYHRYYDPRTGRYITPDPIGLAGGINLYAYAGNDPVGGIDPQGLRIVIVGHLAAKLLGRATNPDSYHLAIFIDPDDKSSEGNWPMTIGGQPSAIGYLVTAINYPGDSIENATFQQEIQPPDGKTECQFINDLIDAAGRYNNKLAYSFPDIGIFTFVRDGNMAGGLFPRYNSNSYISGLLIAVGVEPPVLNTGDAFQTPGYANPIPIPPRR